MEVSKPTQRDVLYVKEFYAKELRDLSKAIRNSRERGDDLPALLATEIHTLLSQSASRVIAHLERVTKLEPSQLTSTPTSS